MNVLTDTFRGLVRRRLWPVALVLLAALAAVPMLLSKDPAPAPVASAAPVSGVAASAPDDGSQTALVAAGDDAQSGHRRYVLGAKKDPFAPAPLPKAKHHPKKAQKSSAASTAPAAGTGDSGSSGATPPASSAPAPLPVPVPARPTYPANSLTVRFGLVSGTPAAHTLQRDHALPNAYHPVLVYTGLENGGRTAVFMVGADVAKLEGDGTCTPDAAGCDTLRLKAGDTEFVTVGKTVYELDLEKVHASKSGSAKAATARVARRATRPKVHF